MPPPGCSRACPDCPASRNAAFASMLPHDGTPCAFLSVVLEARQPLPAPWFALYGVAIVRRGIVARQRIDAHGGATTIDVAGPGCILPLARDVGATGYTVTDSLVCLCPRGTLDAALDGPSARDLIRMQAAALERVDRLADARSRATAATKVGALLCALADTLSPPRTLRVIPRGLHQRDLAALLAMRHESVCRVMRTLYETGALARGPEGIEITDRSQLEAL